MKKLKKFNEDFNQSVDTMKNTTATYSKYKGRISTMVNSEDLEKSSEDFENFIQRLPDAEKESADLLRSLFNSEMMKAKIEKLQVDKKAIEEELGARIKELQDMQSNLPT